MGGAGDGINGRRLNAAGRGPRRRLRPPPRGERAAAAAAAAAPAATASSAGAPPAGGRGCQTSPPAARRLGNGSAPTTLPPPPTRRAPRPHQQSGWRHSGDGGGCRERQQRYGFFRHPIGERVVVLECVSTSLPRRSCGSKHGQMKSGRYFSDSPYVGLTVTGMDAAIGARSERPKGTRDEPLTARKADAHSLLPPPLAPLPRPR